MNKYFIDFEFIEDGKTIEPITIGIVCEDGREYYRGFLETDLSKANSWVEENVIKYLIPKRFLMSMNNDVDLKNSQVPMFNGRGNPLVVEAKMEIIDCDFWKPKETIKQEIIDFVFPSLDFDLSTYDCTLEESIDNWIKFNGKPEFWADYASYDWVAFCQIFGTMMDLPYGFPMYIHDVMQLADLCQCKSILPKQKKQLNILLSMMQNIVKIYTIGFKKNIIVSLNRLKIYMKKMRIKLWKI